MKKITPPSLLTIGVILEIALVILGLWILADSARTGTLRQLLRSCGLPVQ